MALIKCPNCGREMSERATQCPQCGMAMVDINTALHPPEANESPNVEDYTMNHQLKEEQVALQVQVATLKEEAQQLNDAIMVGERELDDLKAEKQRLLNDIEQGKASENKLQDLRQEIDKLQQQTAAFREEAQQQQNAVAASRSELDKIQSQVAAAKKALRDASRPSKGYIAFVCILCTAIVATIAWIICMLITFNN